MYCNYCGAYIKDEYTYCNYCGAHRPVYPSKPKGSLWLPLNITLFMFLFGLIVYLWPLLSP